MSKDLGYGVLPALTARLKAQQAAQDFQRRAAATIGPIDLNHFAAEAVRGRFGRVSRPELDVLVAIVLSETLRLLEEDSRELEVALGKFRRAEIELRGAIRSAQLQALRPRGTSGPSGPRDRCGEPFSGSKIAFKTTETSHLGISYCTPVDDAGESLVGYYESTFSGGTTIQSGKDLLNDLKGKLDGMNEMSEMTSLRLQMTMDRRSKFISTLSQMMKKISTTQDMLVQNIK